MRGDVISEIVLEQLQDLVLVLCSFLVGFVVFFGHGMYRRRLDHLNDSVGKVNGGR